MYIIYNTLFLSPGDGFAIHEARHGPLHNLEAEVCAVHAGTPTMLLAAVPGELHQYSTR